MNKKKHTQVLFSILVTILSSVSLVSILLIPADPKHSLVFGYSLERLLLITVILLLLGLSIWLAWGSWKQTIFSSSFFQWIDDQERKLRIAFGVNVLLLAFLIMIPPDQFGKFQAYFERLLPIIVWWFGFSLLICGWIAAHHGTGFSILVEEQKKEKRSNIIILVAFATLVVVWITPQIASLGYTGNKLWNEGSVPLLLYQVLFATVAATIFLLLNKTDKVFFGRKSAIKIDAIIFVVIWLITILVWSAQPMLRHPLLTAPSAPNYEFYSDSDGETYDAGARYLSLGQGINNLRSTDKPAYIFFLGIIQSIVGLKYEKIILGQTIVLALLPAVLYSLGKELHNRSAGIIAALLGIFLEVNSYLLTLDIQVSHAKLFMSELPTALLLALVTWLFFRYQRLRDDNGQGISMLILGGGISALAVFTRPNVYLVIPVLILSILATEKTLKTRWTRSAQFLLGFSLIAIPWYIGVPSGLSVIPKIKAIVETRYEITNSPQQVETENENQFFAPNDEPDNDLTTDTPFWVAGHFLHNLTGSTLALPLSAKLNLGSIVNTPLWDSTWNGKVHGISLIFMLLNFILLATGFSASREKEKLTGWLPLLIFISYHLANALAQTSGSRYLVPIEWIVLLYYAIGLSRLTESGILWWQKCELPRHDTTKNTEETPKIFKKWIPITTIICLILIGFSMPLSDILIKDKINYPAKPEAWNILIEAGIIDYLQQEGINTKALEEQILSNDSIIIYHGTAMNPRYFTENKGNQSNDDLSRSRMAFLGIGQYTASINLPLHNDPGVFPNGTEFYMIGCIDDERIDWMINGRSSQKYPIEGLISAQVQDSGWTFLSSSTLEELSLCP